MISVSPLGLTTVISHVTLGLGGKAVPGKGSEAARVRQRGRETVPVNKTMQLARGSLQMVVKKMKQLEVRVETHDMETTSRPPTDLCPSLTQTYHVPLTLRPSAQTACLL
jgi:hypothetical protein